MDDAASTTAPRGFDASLSTCVVWPGERAEAVEEPPVWTASGSDKPWHLSGIRELWRYREVVFFLTWRDVKVRYKQTLFGAGWTILQPLLMMVIFTIVFHRMAGVSTGGLPYPLFALSGLLGWVFFSAAVTKAGNSVVISEPLITKVYFPRLAIPLASVTAALFDLFIAYTMLLALQAWYGRFAPTTLVMLPLVVFFLVLAALGIGTLLAALNVAYRDFRYVIPFLLQLWLFATPTVYMQPAPPAAAVSAEEAAAADTPSAGEASVNTARPTFLPHWLRYLVAMNPLTGLVASFRAAALGTTFPWGSFAQSSAVTVVLFVAGYCYFRRVEWEFADII